MSSVCLKQERMQTECEELTANGRQRSLLTSKLPKQQESVPQHVPSAEKTSRTSFSGTSHTAAAFGPTSTRLSLQVNVSSGRKGVQHSLFDYIYRVCAIK